MVAAWVLAISTGAIGLILLAWVVVLLRPEIARLFRRTNAD